MTPGRCRAGRPASEAPYTRPTFRGVPLLTDGVLYVALATSLIALGLAAFYALKVMAASPGNERMVEISAAIREGC